MGGRREGAESRGARGGKAETCETEKRGRGTERGTEAESGGSGRERGRGRERERERVGVRWREVGRRDLSIGREKSLPPTRPLPITRGLARTDA
jgi:hypothetical protein